ncbi:MAG: HDOD domain-containing protein [Desulfobulbaceae bacterium]|nr:HDOD domain-containing protein [Desulfobulbaceae bacterium]
MNKKTILFVDDEPKILKSLRRMLYPLSTDWNMIYVESGAHALEILAQTPTAVLVSDMRMPSMTGLELLKIVQNRYPEIVRVMLTGQPGKDMYCDVMAISHYFLWKPTSFENFEALFGRIKELDSILKDEHLVRLIGGISSLPSLPELFTRLTELLDKPEANSAQIATVIGDDLAMTAQILKLVNSAFFNLLKRVDTLSDAVAYLGLDMIRNLVLVQHLFSQFTPEEYQEFQLNQSWQHSFCVANLSEQIVTSQCKIGQDHKHHSYLAGLLLDIGKLVLIRHLPDTYREILVKVAQEDRAQVETEREYLGTDHAAIGAYLASLWGLPREIFESIALHHKELPVNLSGPSSITEAVWHATRICHGDFSLSESNNAIYSLGKQFVSGIESPSSLPKE